MMYHIRKLYKYSTCKMPNILRTLFIKIWINLVRSNLSLMILKSTILNFLFCRSRCCSRRRIVAFEAPTFGGVWRRRRGRVVGQANEKILDDVIRRKRAKSGSVNDVTGSRGSRFQDWRFRRPQGRRRKRKRSYLEVRLLK